MSFPAWSRRGGLAAALSTADGLLLTITSALSHDVYFRVFRPQSSTQFRLVIAKILLLVVALGLAIFKLVDSGQSFYDTPAAHNP